MSDNLPSRDAQGEFLLYQSEDGYTKVSVRVHEKTLWLSQKQIADLYQVSVKTANEHLINAYNEGEIEAESTIRKFRIVQTEGSRQVERQIEHYNLNAILAVGYRVRSHRGIQFRKWATAQLKELLIKGFVLDDERLKEGRSIGADYFDELLERIRDIRASERRFYQKIADIYATSIDYDPRAEITLEFFKTVQNKLHWAIHGQTAAEVIHERADATAVNMGLTTWTKGPKGRIRKSDVTVAKNYLNEKELSELNRIVGMFLDYAEDQAANRRAMHMADWIAKLDGFLQFNERNILSHAGKISHDMAKEQAEAEFEKYEEQRRLIRPKEESDFDRFVEETKELSTPNTDQKKSKDS